jgi:FSR family fosmidomycin resistance protein-like MFS transporter
MAVETWDARIAARSARDDARVIGFVGLGHFMSHFLQLVLPPIFPLLRERFGVNYVALGFVLSVFFAASGIGQASSGFLVDRFGARRLLQGGFALYAAGIALMGTSGSYAMLVLFALVAGLGNSVFHPADYAIFNSTVHARRLGRAYSIHSVLGSLGWAAAPPTMLALTALFGWRGALIAVGGLALLIGLVVMGQTRGLPDHRGAAARAAPPRTSVLADLRVLLGAPVLFAFSYFLLLAAAWVGLQTFGVPVIAAIYEAPLSTAATAVTGWLLGIGAGTLMGGMLADRTRRHDAVAGLGLLAAALLTFVVATGALSLALVVVAMTISGFCLGITSPSRDMLVRGATPTGASGKVFGFVYSGLDLGSAVTPLLLGWFMDRGEPRLVFVFAGVMLLVTIATVLQVRRASVPLAART